MLVKDNIQEIDEAITDQSLLPALETLHFLIKV